MRFNTVSLLILSPVLFLAGVCNAQGQSAGPNGGDFSQQLNPIQKVPSGVILVKGAWASASDSVTPVPEGGQVSDHVYSNPYFRLTYPLSRNWVKKYDGPPPSDSGYYVLAQLEPDDTANGTAGGTIMVAAADLFFTPTHAGSARELINFTRSHLQADYQVARAPAELLFAGHSFVRFHYFSPVAGIHWYVLATQIRCHLVEFVFSSRDVKLLDRLVRDAAALKLPAEASLNQGAGGGEVPVCIKDYARQENLLQRADPILTEHRYNSIPVRVIIDRDGRVEHIHFLSAFPEQAKAISDALHQWRFKPYLQDGHPVEVETGILFGRQPQSAPVVPAQATASTSPTPK